MEPEPVSFRHFVMEMSLLVENAGGESEIIDRGKKLLKTLVSDNSWFSDVFIQHNSKSYSQNLLYLDPQERFSIICFVW